MSTPIMIALLLLACLSFVCGGGHGGGGHKKVLIHVPLYVKHHHHKHTIVKHIHHKHGGGGGDDHYEVLGYTYGEPKAAPHGGGHHFGAADEGHDYDGPTSFDGGDHQDGYALSDDYGSDHIGY